MLLKSVYKNNVQLKNVRKFLAEKNVKISGTSYESFISKLNNINNDSLPDNFDETLDNFVINNLIFNHKIIYSISFGNDIINQIIGELNEDEEIQKVKNVNDELEAFNPDSITSLRFSSPKLLFTKETEDYYCLLFVNKHSKEFKSEVDRNLFRGISSHFTKMYGVEKRNVISFDSIILDKETNVIHFMIDNNSSLDLSNKTHYNYFKELRNSFTNFSSTFESVPHIYLINNFYLVNTFYSSEIGKVHKLGFNTSTGSTKFEVMNDDICLRDENYHSTGKRSIEAITPFYIEIMNQNEMTNNSIYQKIGGNSLLLNKTNPEVVYYELIGCQSWYDFAYIRDLKEEIILNLTDGI